MGLFGGDNGAEDTLKAVLAQIQGIKTPDPETMQIQIEKLVQQGILTPEQARVYLQQGNALEGRNIDQTGTQAQIDTINKLRGITEAGGRDAQSEMDLQAVIDRLASEEKGSREAILQGAAQRGTLTGGQTLAAQLEGNQSATANAHRDALASNAAAEQRALAALTSLGQAGQGLQGQQNTQSNTVAEATNAINQFNAAQQNQAEQWNTANRNSAQAANLGSKQEIANANTGMENQNRTRNADLIQQDFNNQINKAGASANAAGALANQQQSSANADSAFWGNLIGAGASTLGSVYGGPKQQPVKKSDGGMIHNFLEGGEVPGEAEVQGDSPENDTVPAMLSPGEVVLPRSVVNDGSPDKVMSFLSRMRGQPKQHHPEDVSLVLKALQHARHGA